MKNDAILNFPVTLEEYDLECYRRVDYSGIHCRMADVLGD
jgi:hypothetical protein